jgi:hypothetical protein
MPNSESVDIFVATDDILKHIDRSTLATLSLDDYDAARRQYEALAAKPERQRQRRERKPSVATLIKRAEKAGKTVTAITTDGVTLQFGEAQTEETNNDPWERAMQGPKQ